MTYDEIAAFLTTDPVAQELLRARIPARLAYVARDGSPRVIPISYLWDGAAFIINTPVGWPKIAALQANPKVAITIDSNDFPPNILLVRGEVTKMEERQGVPPEYVAASRRIVGAAQMPKWEAEVRQNITAMTVITITPTWIKLNDFVRNFPGPQGGK